MIADHPPHIVMLSHAWLAPFGRIPLQMSKGEVGCAGELCRQPLRLANPDPSLGHPDRGAGQVRVEGLEILIWKTKPAWVRVRWPGMCTIPCTCGPRALNNLGFSAGQKMAEGVGWCDHCLPPLRPISPSSGARADALPSKAPQNPAP